MKLQEDGDHCKCSGREGKIDPEDPSPYVLCNRMTFSKHIVSYMSLITAHTFLSQSPANNRSGDRPYHPHDGEIAKPLAANPKLH